MPRLRLFCCGDLFLVFQPHLFDTDGEPNTSSTGAALSCAQEARIEKRRLNEDG
jgi:hypothetical protein